MDLLCRPVERDAHAAGLCPPTVRFFPLTPKSMVEIEPTPLKDLYLERRPQGALSEYSRDLTGTRPYPAGRTNYARIAHFALFEVFVARASGIGLARSQYRASLIGAWGSHLF